MIKCIWLIISLKGHMIRRKDFPAQWIYAQIKFSKPSNQN